MKFRILWRGGKNQKIRSYFRRFCRKIDSKRRARYTFCLLSSSDKRIKNDGGNKVDELRKIQPRTRAAAENLSIYKLPKKPFEFSEKKNARSNLIECLVRVASNCPKYDRTTLSPPLRYGFDSTT